VRMRTSGAECCMTAARIAANMIPSVGNVQGGTFVRSCERDVPSIREFEVPPAIAANSQRNDMPAQR
jgi:hypothetical protein